MFFRYYYVYFDAGVAVIWIFCYKTGKCASVFVIYFLGTTGLHSFHPYGRSFYHPSSLRLWVIHRFFHLYHSPHLYNHFNIFLYFINNFLKLVMYVTSKQ